MDKFKLPWVWPRTKNIHISSSCDLSEVIDQNHCDHRSVTLCRVSHNCKWNWRSVNEDTPCIVKWDIYGLANLHNTTKGYFSLGLFIKNKPSNNLLFFLFSQLVYLTKAYNLCHQVAIRWTNEKRDRAQQGPKPHCTSTWSQVVRLHEASQCSFKAPLYGYEATLLGFMKPRRDKCHLNLWISRQLGHTRPRH